MNVKSICDTVKNVIQKTVRSPFPSIPAIIMLCSLAKRPGLSSIMSLVNVVQKFKKYGIPTEPNEDGSPNLNVQYAYIILDEVYRALREDANIQGAGAPASISFSGSGANAGGNVQVFGTNTQPFKIVAGMS